MEHAEDDSGERGDLLTTQGREEICRPRRENFEIAARERDPEGEPVFAKELDRTTRS